MTVYVTKESFNLIDRLKQLQSSNFENLSVINDIVVNGVTVGLGPGSVRSNAVLGNGAMLHNVTGFNNVAVGTDAMRLNIDAKECVAVGYKALYSQNEFTFNNVAIGREAMYTNTAGYNNTALGTLTLYDNTTGNFNTAVGCETLPNNTTGTGNIGIGYATLLYNTSGDYNVGLGYAALLNNTTGVYNIAIGRDSGTYITTGSYNTILGRFNGNEDGLDIRTTNNNIVLADGARNLRMYYHGTDNAWAFLTGSTTTEHMRITSTGKIGIGTSSPSQRLDVASLGQAVPNVNLAGPSVDNNWAGCITFYSYDGSNVRNGIYNSTGGMQFHVNNAERARIDWSGNLLVGQTSTTNAAKFAYTFNGASASGISSNDSSGLSGSVHARWLSNSVIVGSISTTSTATAYNTSSDYRLKENVAPMQNALATVVQLNPVTYTWKADGSAGQGFIAHELQAVVPDAVTGEKDAVDEEGNPEYQGVDTSFLVATLTKAIQEQQEQINDLKAQVAALSGS